MNWFYHHDARHDVRRRIFAGFAGLVVVVDVAVAAVDTNYYHHHTWGEEDIEGLEVSMHMDRLRHSCRRQSVCGGRVQHTG